MRAGTIAHALTLLVAFSGCRGDRPLDGTGGGPTPPGSSSARPPLLAASLACLERDKPAFTAPDDDDPAPRDAVSEPEKPSDLCAVADSNLKRAADLVLAAPRAAPATTAAPARPWDHRQKPARLDEVTQRFALQPGEIEALQKNGFVVPARLAPGTYAQAFHEIYQSEMPLYVSVDAILHAVFRGSDAILARLEERHLAPLLERTLALMACALPAAAARYPAETARDLDLTLTVARSLLANHPVAPAYDETGARAEALVAKANAAGETATVELFGEPRSIDFSAFAIRSHYAAEEHEALRPYFRAATWLSQLENNLASPALADLAERSGAAPGTRALERAWAAFQRTREDISLEALVAPGTPGRHLAGSADAAYALGQDRALRYLGADLARFPALDARLRETRARVHSPAAPNDLQLFRLAAVAALADAPTGVPSFMTTDAFADLRLDSTIAAFGQIRHKSVVLAGHSYDQSGCEIPDAYVEPALAVYRSLHAYAELGAATVAEVDPQDASKTRAYFATLAHDLRVLDAIVIHELQGHPLSEDARRWLSMIVEIVHGQSGHGATYTGWWFDLFPSRPEALGRAEFIAETFTSAAEGTVTYAGARGPALGIFVIDTGGPPRVVVGPVARAFEHRAAVFPRLEDDDAAKLPETIPPWSQSYLLPAPPSPELALSVAVDGDAYITAPRPLGPVTVTMLDHHRRPIESVTRTAGAGTTVFAFKAPPEDRPAEAIHLHVGAFDAWDELGNAEGAIFDFTHQDP